MDVLVRQHEELGEIFTMTLQGVPTVVCGGTTGPTQMFRAERGHLQVFNTAPVHDLFGRAVFNLSGAEHLQARRMLHSGLVGAPLQEYTVCAARIAQSHIKQWAAGSFSLYSQARELTLDACAQIILGLHPGELDFQILPETLEAFVCATEISSVSRHTSPTFQRGQQAAGELRALCHRRIDCASHAFDPSVLFHLVQYHKRTGLNVAELPDHLLALLIATRETTASLMTWLLVELSQTSAVAEAVQREAQTLLREPLLLGDPKAAPVLRAALLEAERLHSPNAVSLRTVVHDLLIGRYEIPRGWNVAYSPAANHLLPQNYEDPHQFCVHRFAGKRRSRGDLLTFGGGIHSCPGKELAERLVLATAAAVFGEYRLILLEGRPTKVRYLPVKAPVEAVPAILRDTRGMHRDGR